ncbi:MAG TPA: hypothetical protein VLG69_00070 [Candidatus Andersenbacteria bacterium]|nr:hypothetical protein [Candidatus Andersenbacteria bacterium]
MREFDENQQEVARIHAGLSYKQPGDVVDGHTVRRAPQGGLNYRNDRINTIGDTIYRNGVKVGKVSDLKKKKH